MDASTSSPLVIPTVLPSPSPNAKYGNVSREMSADEFIPFNRSQVHSSDLAREAPCDGVAFDL